MIESAFLKNSLLFLESCRQKGILKYFKLGLHPSVVEGRKSCIPISIKNNKNKDAIKRTFLRPV